MKCYKCNSEIEPTIIEILCRAQRKKHPKNICQNCRNKNSQRSKMLTKEKNRKIKENKDATN